MMCTLFSGRHMLVSLVATPIWWLPTGLSKLVQNISTNIYSPEKRTDLKLGEVPHLIISFNILMSLWYVKKQKY